MVKVYRIPGTDVKIRICQDEKYNVFLEFPDGTTALVPASKPDAEIICALGFPTSPTEPIDGGVLEEVTE